MSSLKGAGHICSTCRPLALTSSSELCPSRVTLGHWSLHSAQCAPMSVVGGAQCAHCTLAHCAHADRPCVGRGWSVTCRLDARSSSCKSSGTLPSCLVSLHTKICSSSLMNALLSFVFSPHCRIYPFTRENRDLLLSSLSMHHIT